MIVNLKLQNGFRGNGWLLVVGLLFNLIMQAKIIDNKNDFLWAIRAGSADRPAMVAALCYDGQKSDLTSLKKLRSIFNKASHNKRYKDYVEFLEFDFGQVLSRDLVQLSDHISNEPLVILFANGVKVDELYGFNHLRSLINFINHNFGNQIADLRHIEQDRAEKMIRYSEYPPYYFGASFGEPFYSSYAGRQYYGGYYYPYSYSLYFNTAFFTSMAI